MSKMLSYGKTTDFKSFLRNIANSVRFDGLDDQGLPKYNNNPLPTVSLIGTVKLHGTNAAVSMQDGKLVCMSRKNIVADSGHMGFPFMVSNNSQIFEQMFQKIATPKGIIPTIYGEWAGKGIQKGVGIANFEKAFYIFGVRMTEVNDEGEINSYWLDHNTVSDLTNKPDSEALHYPVRNIHDFPTFNINVDLNNPKDSQNQLVQFTNNVEKDCPVSRKLVGNNPDLNDVELVGEGVVWECFINGERHNFKVKGERHSVSKVKTLVEIDPVMLANVNEFSDRVVTENRVKQAMSEIVIRGDVIGKQDTGSVLKWMMDDILAEERQVMVESSLEPKDIANKVNSATKTLFFKLLEEF